MSRIDEVRLWLGDPVTQQFIAIIQSEIKTAREAAIAAAARGEPAINPAATCEALRNILTDGLMALADESETREAIKDAGNKENPEELHSDGFADALQANDRDDDVDGDPPDGPNQRPHAHVRGARQRPGLRR